MTKKDFELIAEVIRDTRGDRQGDIAQLTPDSLSVRMSNALESTNPRFDAARFRRACA